MDTSLLSTYGSDVATFEEVGVFTAIWSAFIAFIATYALVVTLVSVLMIVAMWILFKKAGKPGWAAIVPVYNTVVLFQISGLNPWLLLLGLVPVLGQITVLILGIVGCFKLAKAFGKDVGYGFGLWLLPVIFYPIIAFGKSQYVGLDKVAPAAPATEAPAEEKPQE